MAQRPDGYLVEHWRNSGLVFSTMVPGSTPPPDYGPDKKVIPLYREAPLFRSIYKNPATLKDCIAVRFFGCKFEELDDGEVAEVEKTFEALVDYAR
ncbi:hypothetical protein FDI24_gp225 [Acidovorax phage ACP17]|uniref:Uncharacterized protein n=1 Tax=Acidovorax phage ACP17 TaxID=2010329 RepID=A0A223AJ11_9CAUD|nr:hypothetical protein FDI24_gp225 [Acidovorax phage ACP17]ASS33944.1 hypothetical protein [Acidovorax phage ACP17]